MPRRESKQRYLWTELQTKPKLIEGIKAGNEIDERRSQTRLSHENEIFHLKPCKSNRAFNPFRIQPHQENMNGVQKLKVSVSVKAHMQGKEEVSQAKGRTPLPDFGF